MLLQPPTFPSARRAFLVFNMLAVAAVIFYLFAVFGEGRAAPPHLDTPSHHDTDTMAHDAGGKPTSNLANHALQKVLEDASPIFGHFEESSKSDTSIWMKAYPDDTKLVRMNIPGTHDAATWNYSKATQQRLEPIAALNGISEVDPNNYRCQDNPFITMLNDGIRAFDLRYAHDVTNTTLVFWHGIGLQSQTATLDSLLFGFYAWLDAHPSEALFLSFQFEGNSIPNSANDLSVQSLLYDSLTSPAAKQYISQTNTLATLGSARGRITLLRRFDLNLLPSSQSANLPGLHFSPADWGDNPRNNSLVYDAETQAVAHIQDYYSPEVASDASAEEIIGSKFDACTDFFDYAASDAAPDELFWSFASSTKIGNEPPSTPRIQALGNGTELTPEGGVNDRLVEYLRGKQGKRLGIVMFDFYEQPGELLETFLGLSPP